MKNAFYTVEKISKHREYTPEGFMLCRETPIARTGTQVYGSDELEGIGVEPDSEGRIQVERNPEDVFHPRAISSANGKSFVNEHPPEDVDPKNWKRLTGGFLINPRRGEGMKDGLLIADLMICDQDMIELVNEGKKELSCGYDADYEPLGPGRAKQTNIIINHVALVDSGRCGPRCSIGDHQLRTEMANSQKRGKMLDWLRRAKRATNDEDLSKMADDAVEEIEGAESEPDDMRYRDDTGNHIHVHTGGEDARSRFTDDDLEEYHKKNDAEHAEFRSAIQKLQEEMKKLAGEERHEDDEGHHQDDDNKEIEGELEEEAPEGTGDKARKARDSAYLVESMQDTIAAAEIIAPGIRVPSFDRKAPPKKTLDSITNLRRSALELAYGNAKTRGIIDEALNGRPFKPHSLTRDGIRSLFRTVSAIKRRENNLDDDAGVTAAGKALGGTINSPADLNKTLNEYYKNH